MTLGVLGGLLGLCGQDPRGYLPWGGWVFAPGVGICLRGAWLSAGS